MGQLQDVDAIDSKIGLAFTTSTALLGILAAVLALKAGKFDPVSYATVAASVLVYLYISRKAWIGYRIREWWTGPERKQVCGVLRFQ